MMVAGASGQSPLQEPGLTMSVSSAYRVRGAIGRIFFHSVRSQELKSPPTLVRAILSFRMG